MLWFILLYIALIDLSDATFNVFIFALLGWPKTRTLGPANRYSNDTRSL